MPMSEEEQKLAIEKREADTLAEIRSQLDEITRLNPDTLTLDQRQVLTARRDYLSHQDLERFQGAIDLTLQESQEKLDREAAERELTQPKPDEAVNVVADEKKEDTKEKKEDKK